MTISTEEIHGIVIYELVQSPPWAVISYAYCTPNSAGRTYLLAVITFEYSQLRPTGLLGIPQYTGTFLSVPLGKDRSPAICSEGELDCCQLSINLPHVTMNTPVKQCALVYYLLRTCASIMNLSASSV